ncbi:MAG: hypothetical protein FJZ58_07470, partial [Chlamydiae bacterium]|nr:hypothetical protein [Chlamydiota bacterium]
MKTLMVCSFLWVLPCFALLPPLYQGVQEVEKILHSSDLAPYAGESLCTIEKTNEGYLVETNKHSLWFIVTKLPSSQIGPMPFSISLQKVTKRC